MPWLGFCPHCSEGKASHVSQAARLITPGSREIRGSCTLLPCRQVTLAALSIFCCSRLSQDQPAKSKSAKACLDDHCCANLTATVCADFPGSEFVIFVTLFSAWAWLEAA